MGYYLYLGPFVCRYRLYCCTFYVGVNPNETRSWELPLGDVMWAGEETWGERLLAGQWDLLTSNLTYKPSKWPHAGYRNYK